MSRKGNYLAGLTQKRFEALGYWVEQVQVKGSQRFGNQDPFRVVDMIAVKPNDGVLFIQSTTRTQKSRKMKKIRASQEKGMDWPVSLVLWQKKMVGTPKRNRWICETIVVEPDEMGEL